MENGGHFVNVLTNYCMPSMSSVVLLGIGATISNHGTEGAVYM